MAHAERDACEIRTINPLVAELEVRSTNSRCPERSGNSHHYLVTIGTTVTILTGLVIVTRRTFSLFNPVVYLISEICWSFYGTADVGVGVNLGMTLVSWAWRWSSGFSEWSIGSRAEGGVP